MGHRSLCTGALSFLLQLDLCLTQRARLPVRIIVHNSSLYLLNFLTSKAPPYQSKLVADQTPLPALPVVLRQRSYLSTRRLSFFHSPLSSSSGIRHPHTHQYNGLDDSSDFFPRRSGSCIAGFRSSSSFFDDDGTLTLTMSLPPPHLSSVHSLMSLRSISGISQLCAR